MKPRAQIVAVLSLLLIPSITGTQADPQRGGEKPSSPPEPREQPAPGAARGGMNMRLKAVEFDSIELKSIIDYFREVSGMNIVVNWDALKAVGVERDKLVTLKLHNVEVSKALELVLQKAEGGVTSLACVADEDVLVISTRDDLSRKTVTLTYNVADLVNADDPKEVEGLLGAVRETAEPDSWRPAGNGSIVHYKGSLIVTHTKRTQQDVLALLGRLREDAKARPESPRALAEKARERVELVGSMKETVEDAEAMGLIAVAGIRDDVARKPAAVIADLEAMLEKVKTISLRNAIRLALKDLYKAEGKSEKVVEHLRQMLLENDAALSRKGERPE
jgi:hypothetical protein